MLEKRWSVHNVPLSDFGGKPVATMSPHITTKSKAKKESRQEIFNQIAKIGISPSDVISHIMSDPEKAAAFCSPVVQKALVESAANPLILMDFMENPEIGPAIRKLKRGMLPLVTSA